MKTNINTTNSFWKQAKRLVKKYKSLKSELEKLEKELHEKPQMGVALGNNSFKIRLAAKSKGKRGGLRVITYLDIVIYEDEIINELYLLTIYDKSQTSSIPDREILNLINQIRD